MSEKNSTRFLTAFSKMEHMLNEMVRPEGYMPFVQLVDMASRKNRIIQRNNVDLKQYAELRNAIVHHRDSRDEVIAEPTDVVTASFEKLVEQLEIKYTILEFASKEVEKLSIHDQIQYAYARMKKYNTSKLPVYQGNRFIDILTIEEIAEYVMNHLDKEAPIEKALRHDDKKQCIFLPSSTDVNEVISICERYYVKGNTKFTIILTRTGNKDEAPVGIFTNYDLAKMFVKVGITA